MTRRAKWLVGSAAIAVVVAVIAMLVPREPRYHGRGLSEWTAELSHPHYRTQQVARAAIQAIGPAAVPFLTNFLAQRDAPSVRLYRTGVIPQRLLNATRKLIVWQSPIIESRNAAQALSAIGTNATAAIPELIAVLRDPNFLVSQPAAMALGSVGTNALPALRQRLGLADDLELPLVLLALGYMGTNAAPLAEEVAPLLESATPSFGDRAASALMSMGPAAVSVTTNFLSHTNVNVQLRALNVLRQAGPPTLFWTNVLLPLARSMNPEVRLGARQTFGAWYAPPEISAPVWLEGIRDSDLPNVELSLRFLTMYPTNVRAFKHEIALLATHPSAPIREIASNALTVFKAWPDQHVQK